MKPSNNLNDFLETDEIKSILENLFKQAPTQVYYWPVDEEDYMIMASHYIDINYFNGKRILAQDQSFNL